MINPDKIFAEIDDLIIIIKKYAKDEIDGLNPEIIYPKDYIEKLKINIEKIIEGLCSNSSNTSLQDKITALTKAFEYDVNYGEDIISRWRDGLRYLKGLEYDHYLDLLKGIVRELKIPSHERLVTCIFFYNSAIFSICYDYFLILIKDESCEVHHKIEAINFLFGSEEYKEITKKTIIEFVEDTTTNSESRYKIICSFIPNTGIRSKYNFTKLRIPCDKEFVIGLQLSFFNNDNNDIRFRTLSGQYLLQNYIPKPNETRLNISTTLINISKDVIYDENTRAEAADIILRLGTNEEKLEARKIITLMGYSSDGKKRKLLFGPKTIYDNSQTSHDLTIDAYTQNFIENMIENSTIKQNLLDYDKVVESVSNLIRETVKSQAFKNNAYRALQRIEIDTSTFSKYGVTNAEILVNIWSRINSDEFDENTQELLKKRLTEEIVEMDNLCPSGYASRFVNIFSSIIKFYNSLKISWFDQIKANISGRINASIRDCENEELRETLILGMMNDAQSIDKDVYISFIKNSFELLYLEMKQEFLGVDNQENIITESEFDTHFKKIQEEWENDIF